MVAIGIAVISFSSIKEKRNSNAETKKLAIEKNRDQAGASKTVVKEKQEDLVDTTIDADYIINKNFQLVGMEEAVLPFIDNDVDTLVTSLQQYLYTQGYYQYTKAVMDENVQLNVKEKEISLVFVVAASTECYIKATYRQKTKVWEYYQPQ